MSSNTKNNQLLSRLWSTFSKKHALTQLQEDQFKKYLALLQEWAELINITTIIDSADIIAYHFNDSLAVKNVVDLPSFKGVMDVGSGGGFPGIPLKIMYPELPIYLLEVNGKKISFLRTVIEQLGLENIELCALDWRTFIKKTDYKIDLFLSRASLHTDELARLFGHASSYRNAQLIYWASNQWQSTPKDKPYLVKEEAYVINHKKRRFIFFSLVHATI